MFQRQIIRRQPQVSTDDCDKVDEVLSRVLANRNIKGTSALKFSLSDLLPPLGLKGIAQAAKLLAEAITQQKKIIIVGDYDVDGATATAVSILGLGQLGAEQVTYAVPDRFAYGYGLSEKMALTVCEGQPDLVITVDNGISSIQGVELLRQAGIEVIITDHHLAGEELPKAHAIVNPNQPGCSFASKALCGVGVVFYLLLATRQQLSQQGWFSQGNKPALVDLLDLVALGTVADVVPLDENNRILVSQGIARIRAGKTRPGILALLEMAKRSPQALITTDLSFGVAPRLNAAGRLADIQTGIECLLSSDLTIARKLAIELNDINLARREIEASMQAEAVDLVKKMDLTTNFDSSSMAAGLALFHTDWHEGVVGLVASRIKDKTGRPTVVFAPGDDGDLKGSARSIPGVHIRDVFADIDARYPTLILRYGGHAMAAGLSLKVTDFDQFSDYFSGAVERALDGKPADHSIETDGALNTQEFNLSVAESLRIAAPWGQAFPPPSFDNEFHVLNARIVGKIHLKLLLQAIDGGPSIDAIAFRYVEDTQTRIDFKRVRAVYQLDVNEYRGQKTVQLIIEYLEEID